MAPNRTKPRQTHSSHHPATAPSQPQTSHVHQFSTASDFDADFDSDVPGSNNPALAAGVAASIPSRTNAELNLSVLQRHNPEVTNVLSIAPYAVVYTFAAERESWEKSGVEGTLFVCQLSSSTVANGSAIGEIDRFAVFILNRRGLENFFIELLSADDVEVTEDYIIIQEHKDTGTAIHGLWVFAEPPPSSTAAMRTINAKAIQDCAARAERSRSEVEAHARQMYGQNNIGGNVAAPASPPAAVDMGRLLSLRQLFSQSRDANGSSIPLPQRDMQPIWPQQMYPPSQYQQYPPPPLAQQYPQPAWLQAQQPPSYAQQNNMGGNAGGGVLGDLFRKARQGYNGS